MEKPVALTIFGRSKLNLVCQGACTGKMLAGQVKLSTSIKVNLLTKDFPRKTISGLTYLDN